MGPVVAGMPAGGPPGTDPSQGFPPARRHRPGREAAARARVHPRRERRIGRIGSAAGSNGGGAGVLRAPAPVSGPWGRATRDRVRARRRAPRSASPAPTCREEEDPLAGTVRRGGTGDRITVGRRDEPRRERPGRPGTDRARASPSGDPLPDLEPAQDGPSPSGSKTGGPASSAAAGGSRGPDLGGPGPGTSAMGGGPSNASARPGSQTGRPAADRSHRHERRQPGPPGAVGGTTARRGERPARRRHAYRRQGRHRRRRTSASRRMRAVRPLPPTGAIGIGLADGWRDTTTGGAGDLAANAPAGASGSGPWRRDGHLAVRSRYGRVERVGRLDSTGRQSGRGRLAGRGRGATRRLDRRLRA